LFVEPDEQAEPKLSQTTAARPIESFTASPARGLEMFASEFLHAASTAAVRFLSRSGPTAFHRTLSQSEPRTHVNHNHLQTFSRRVDRAGGIGTADEAPMKGLDYLHRAVLAQLWDKLEAHVREAIAQTPGGVDAYLQKCDPVWNTVGHVTFHLAENKRNLAYPFAFLATYTHRVSERGKAQHLPLGRALEEHAGAKNRAELAALLSPVQRAAEQSKLACELLDVTPRASLDYAGNVAGSLVGSPGFWSNTTSGPSTLVGVKSQN
jgi:hypothetical protein